MPKLLLQRLLALCAVPLCALPASAQRPSNALPPPTDAPPRRRPAGSTATPTPRPATRPAPLPPAIVRDETSSPFIDSEPIPRAATAPEIEFPQPDLPPLGIDVSSQAPPSAGLDDFLEGRLGALSIPLPEARQGWKSLRVVRVKAAPTAGGGAGSAAEREAVAPLVEDTVSAQYERDPFWQSISQNFALKPNVFVTRGRSLRLNGDEHLVVYRAQFPPIAEAEAWFNARFDPKQEPSLTDVLRLTREFLGTVPLRASLVNTRHVAIIEGVTPFDFEDRFRLFSEFAEAELKRRSPDATETDTVAAPPANNATDAQEAARRNLRLIFAAVQRFRADNGDALPPLDELAEAQASLAPYFTGDKEPWRDPVSNGFFVPNARLSKRPVSRLKAFASSLILVYSPPAPDGSRLVLRLDGVVRQVKSAEWTKLKATSKIS